MLHLDSKGLIKSSSHHTVQNTGETVKSKLSYLQEFDQFTLALRSATLLTKALILSERLFQLSNP